MSSINIQELLKSNYTEPSFNIDFYKVVRPTVFSNECTSKIIKTNRTTCWKIEDKELIELQDNRHGIFFDAETFIVQWLFDFEIDNTLIEKPLVYYWKGQKAPKGFSPLPPEIEEHFPVERVVQWSEPALFFHAFRECVFVFSGTDGDFDSSQPHLMLLRGELKEEIHLFEVPCDKQHLRSRAIFLLIIPDKKCLMYWIGNQTSLEYRDSIVEVLQPHKALSKFEKSWDTFNVLKVVEGAELKVFDDVVKGVSKGFSTNEQLMQFSPKLFYLNSITGDFLATEVDYPLRSSKTIAPFPFLQSHLYTATQPALFLLDNHTTLWLWEGSGDTELISQKQFEEELKLALELVNNYIKEKTKHISQEVKFQHIYAYKEPVEFKNIFPFWN